MEKVLSFLRGLEENNNKEWFDAHRKQYLEAKNIFSSFVTELIDESQRLTRL